MSSRLQTKQKLYTGNEEHGLLEDKLSKIAEFYPFVKQLLIE